MMSFDEIRETVRRCTQPDGPQFYRRLYDIPDGAPALELRDWGEWRSLPLLEKKHLAEVPFRRRLFAQADHARASSGTSGKPVFSPRTEIKNIEYRLEYHDFHRPILAHMGFPPHCHEAFLKSIDRAPRVIVFDPKHPGLSARLARIAGVDSLSMFSFLVPIAGEHLAREGHASTITYVETYGEVLSGAVLAHMQSLFPNARFVHTYGSSEVEDAHIGMPCSEITGPEPCAVYHPKKTHYLELIAGEDIVEPHSDAEGELVITTYAGTTIAFPLIRYRIGDTVRVLDESCERHGVWSFMVLGRTEQDFLKIPGGVLRADEVQRVLRSLAPRVQDRFELHRRDVSTTHGPLVEVTVHVEASEDEDLRTLADDIASRLRVSPGRTYADGVERGLYGPLVCVRLSPDAGSGKKLSRLVAD